MPIYEFRCPNGHTFERFQSMTAPPPDACDVCGTDPVELVLYPIAIHYKGSGFYATDYGKGKAAKKESGGDSAAAASSDTGPKSDAKPEKKAASGGSSD